MRTARFSSPGGVWTPRMQTPLHPDANPPGCRPPPSLDANTPDADPSPLDADPAPLDAHHLPLEGTWGNTGPGTEIL